MLGNLLFELTDILVEEVTTSKQEIEVFFESLDVKSRIFKTFV